MKKKRIYWAITIIILCIVSGLIYVKMQGGQAVETTVTEKGEIKQYIEDIAVVKSNKRQTVYIEGAGKINNIEVNVGDYVKKGDVLLTMDKQDLELKLKDATAKIEAAKAQLASTDSSNYVNKIEIAQAAVDSAKVNYESITRDLNNAKTLFESDAISQQELNKAEDAYKTAEVTLKSANLQVEDAKDGAPDYLKDGYMAVIEQAVILRDSVMREIEKQQVLASIDGIILEKLVDENSMGVTGTVAFLIGDIKSLELEGNILSDDIYKVQIGNEVEVSGKAMGDLSVEGKIIKIAPEAKNITSSLGVNQKRVPVTIQINGETSLLRPGYDLDIKIITQVKSDTLVIPDSAVFDYKGSSCVFIVDSGKAVIREIKKGIESEKTIEVLEGLKEGEKILIKPDNNIKEGMKIKLG
ncbi:RND transporter [Clostridium gelidum]|uniref:RND transporter n=1 Tax=Clostridium gelidum TaxID=704125 RepID=A0ABM7SZ13_9CLOT|nr:HlyD family efflux transporter periplasmic adaptor subunit [Clostridium gelidum]BCZ44917.1 RND transporter [Clostridium gelidum]